MESFLEEKVRKMRVEELERFLERSGIYALLAAKEGLRRYEIGNGKIDERFFISILEAKIEHGKAKEEAKIIKKTVVEILKEKFFNEKSVSAIIDCQEIEMPEKESAVKKYLNLGGKDRYVLKRIIQSIGSVKLKDLVAIELIKQEPKEDELLIIIEELRGKIQMEALKMLFKKGVNFDDKVYLIETVPSVAEIVWKKTLPTTRKKKPKERAEILYEIAGYTDSKNVKRDAIAEMWIIREALDYNKLEYLRENADLIKIENSEKVRNWIDENILKVPRFEEEGFEKIMRVKERALDPKIKEGALERAIEEAEKEIREKEFSDSHWYAERVKFLKEKLKELRKELKDVKECVAEELPATL